MLHSFHYYACYYALLCLLHQQQQAASLTIIIDGATTNEWATKDEYQRLVSGTNPGGSVGNLNTELGASATNEQQQQHSQAGFDSVNGFGGGDGGVGGAVPRHRLNSEPSPIISASSSSLNSNNNNGDQQVLSSSFEPQSAGDLEAAFERLDLIEEEDKQLSLRQKQLKQLELQQRLNIQKQIPLNSNMGARTINDLVPIGDDREEYDDPLNRLKERGSSKQVYCGRELMDVLELVCQGRYYAGESEPQVVDPTIKSKRFIHSDDNNFTGFDGNKMMLHEQLLADQQDIVDIQQPSVSRRRKLRTVELSPLNAPTIMKQNDGVNVNTNINNNDNLNNIDENNHNNMNNNRYLSYSKSIIENNDNNNKNINENRQNLIENINNNNKNYYNNDKINTNIDTINKQLQTTNLTNNVRNKHSKMALYRRIRGANAECCRRACYIEELRPYCKP